MEINDKKSEGFALWGGGVLSGIIASGAIAEIVRLNSVIEFVNEYQTLTTGLIAFAGAFLTVQQIRRQIDNSQRQHEDLINRNLTAVKSVLPLVLSDLYLYSETCISISLDIAHRRALTKEFNPLKDTAFEIYREVIKYSPQERQKQMAELLYHLQMQTARMSRSLENYEPLTSHDHPDRDGIAIGDANITAFNDIFDAEELKVRVGDLYAFAREQDDEIELPRFERFKSNFVQHHISIEDWPNLLAAASRRFQLPAERTG